MNETTNARRDIIAGQPLNKVVNREEGFFYFVTADGSIQRALRARKALTESERVTRALKQASQREAVNARKAERAQRRQERQEAQERLRAERKRHRDERIKKEIAALKAKL